MKTLGMKVTTTFLMTAGLLASAPAQAYDFGGNNDGGPIFIELTGFPGYTSNNQQTSPLGGSTTALNPAVQSGFSYDLRNMVGYKVWGGLLLGLNYNYANSPQNAPATSTLPSVDHRQTWSQWGASLGYVGSNLRLIGTYIFSATEKLTAKDMNQDGSVSSDYVYQNDGGSGYQITLGYAFPISTNIKVGPTIIYRSITYKKQSLTDNVTPGNNYNGDLTVNAVESNLSPMISLIFSF